MGLEPRGWNPIDFERHEDRSRLASVWATCFVFKYDTSYAWKRFDKMRLERLVWKYRKDLRDAVKLLRSMCADGVLELSALEDMDEIEVPNDDEYFEFLRSDEGSLQA